MPCIDGPAGPEPVTPRFASILCGVFTVLEAMGNFDAVLERINWSEVGQPREEIESWWFRHKIEDLHRREQASEKARKQLERDRREYERLRTLFEDKK